MAAIEDKIRKGILKFVCPLSNDVHFNPQVISFSTVYNSPYKIFIFF